MGKLLIACLDIDICLQAASAFADGKLTEINVQKAAGVNFNNKIFIIECTLNYPTDLYLRRQYEINQSE